MQFTQIASLFALAALAQAQDVGQVLSVIINDIQAHTSDYLGYIAAGHAPPPGVLQIYYQLSTYTDNSYTTLYDQVDAGAVESFIAGVPWYSDRLASLLAPAPETSATAEATSSETAVPETSSEAATTSSAPESSAVPASSADKASSTVSIEISENGAGNLMGSGTDSAAYLIVPCVVALSGALLL